MYELHVEGMSCGHCVNRITQAVKAVDAQARLDIDLPHKRVRIESGCEMSVLTDALEQAGYPATP